MFQNQQPRIALVTRQTRLKGLLARWATPGQARYQFVQASAAAAARAGDWQEAAAIRARKTDDDFEEIQDEDATYQAAIRQLIRELDLGMPVQAIDRSLVPNYDFGLCAAVVVVGQDGLVANTAKYVGDTPVVGVNPDPARIDGVLLPFQLHEARAAVQRLLDHRARIRTVSLAEVTLHDGQSMLAFNDLFIGVRTHVSARYVLRARGKSESQSSSGLLVSTGAGSTGWMSSVYNMARGVARAMGGELDAEDTPRLDWEDRELLWAVREPFASRTSGVQLVAGRVTEQAELEVESLIPSGGVIFSDGIEADFLEFNAGTSARIRVAPRQARLVAPP